LLRKIEYNAPVALSFALAALLALFLGWVTNGLTTSRLFCVYGSSWGDPLTYVRLFGHVLGHANLSHYINNMMLLLLVGPMVEEFYGSGRLLVMILLTAVITGLVDMIFFPTTALLGASGVVFMMIILASMVSYQRGRIPLTFFFVAAMYLGQEIYNGIFANDDISQLTHIIGGVLGLVFGLVFRRERR
jgi:membrane associated rhomboid family serine protease